jgi:Resolvase, N terminal domain
MDVIIAARLSKLARGRAQSGIETQDEDAREWAQEQGHRVVTTVADHASGVKKMEERENLGPWVTDPGLMARYQGIVAAKQDRLSRSDWSGESELRRWAETNRKTLFIVDRELRWPPRGGAHHDDDVLNNFEEIARLRRDRSKLDDLADDYAERMTAITAEIRRLAKEDKENPQPDAIKWVPSGKTVREYWESLTTAARRDWLVENKWKVTVTKYEDKWMADINAGLTAEIKAGRRTKSPGPEERHDTDRNLLASLTCGN